MTKNSRQRSLAGRPRVTAEQTPLGVLGLGLMGMSISACLLAAGHPVVALTRDLKRHKGARQQVFRSLRQLYREGILRKNPSKMMRNFSVSDEYRSLSDCDVVIETIVEDVGKKKEALAKIEEVVSATTLIGSNTSAIPVTILQEGAKHPERILGIHWAEPAHVTRFMEIICGKATAIDNAERIFDLATGWGKEPSLLRRDIRGFITNRLMYALLREAFHLVEGGYAAIEDVDRSMRNDLGYWITFAGPFRFMDLTGIPAYAAVMKDLLPELSVQTRVPELMDRIVNSGAHGVANARGFYRYTPEEAKRWEELFVKFTYDIRKIALKYPADISGNHRLANSEKRKIKNSESDFGSSDLQVLPVSNQLGKS